MYAHKHTHALLLCSEKKKKLLIVLFNMEDFIERMFPNCEE